MKTCSASLALSVAALAAYAWPGTGAVAQTVGAGASPGRAAYRPASQWNNGPFYTTPHWDAYGPHRSYNTVLNYSEANAPPYTSAPRGHYAEYDPGRFPLSRYAQGFSPYSGYAQWYQKANHFQPTPNQTAQAAAMFYRSSPIGPDPRYLSPDVTRALYAAPSAVTATAPRVAASRPAVVAAPKVEVPRTQPVPRRSGTAVYRFGPN